MSDRHRLGVQQGRLILHPPLPGAGPHRRIPTCTCPTRLHRDCVPGGVLPVMRCPRPLPQRLFQPSEPQLHGQHGRRHLRLVQLDRSTPTATGLPGATAAALGRLTNDPGESASVQPRRTHAARRRD
jgi:hypothetical protein